MHEVELSELFEKAQLGGEGGELVPLQSQGEEGGQIANGCGESRELVLVEMEMR